MQLCEYTVTHHGLRYILTPASKYRGVYVLCFFFCMCTSTFFTTLLPHPTWHGFHSAPGCRLCTPKLFSFCPTSGTEPVLPFHLPRCADAPRCISAVHWSSLASPLRKTHSGLFSGFSLCNSFTKGIQHLAVLLLYKQLIATCYSHAQLWLWWKSDSTAIRQWKWSTLFYTFKCFDDHTNN